MSFLCDWCSSVDPTQKRYATVTFTQQYDHESRILQVAASAKTDYVATASEKILNFWKYEPETDELQLNHSIGKLGGGFLTSKLTVSQLRFADEGRLLLVLSENAAHIKLFDTESGSEIKTSETDFFVSMEVFDSPQKDRNILVATTSRRDIRFYKVRGGQKPMIEEKYTHFNTDGAIRSNISSLDFYNQGGRRHYIFGHESGLLSHWRPGDKKENKYRIKQVRECHWQNFPITSAFIIDTFGDDIYCVVLIESTANCYFVNLNLNNMDCAVAEGQRSQCVLQKLEPSGLCRSLVVDEDRQTMHVGTSDGRIVTFHYSREKRELQHFQDEAVDNEPLLELSYGKHLIIGRGLQSLHPITCDHDGKQRGTVTSGIADYESSHE